MTEPLAQNLKPNSKFLSLDVSERFSHRMGSVIPFTFWLTYDLVMGLFFPFP